MHTAWLRKGLQQQQEKGGKSRKSTETAPFQSDFSRKEYGDDRLRNEGWVVD
jgi:hypothetical protein